MPKHPYEHRQVALHGMIAQPQSVQWIAQLLFFAHESPGWPVLVRVDSPGGRMIESIAILRTMSDLPCPLATHCHGLAGGTAVAIVAHGRRGFRTATPAARFGFAPTFADPAEGYVEAELSQFDAVMIESLAEATGKHESEVAALFRSRAELTASEAVAFGLVDAVSSVPNLPPPA